MEESDTGEPEETVQEDLHIQDPVVCQVQEVDLDGLQSDKQLQKSGDPTQNEAFKLVVTDETQKLMHQEQEDPAQKVPTRDSRQKSEEKKSSRQECRELEELGQKTDANIMVQEKDESSFALEQDSRQANQPESDAIHQERDVFSKDKLLESGGNATAQRMAEDPENILLVPDQESIQITQQEDNDATQQECDRIVEDESLQPKFKTNLTEQLKEKTHESSIASMEDPTLTAEQEANDGDRTTENDRHFQESESGPELEESRLVCLRTGQLEEVVFLPSPSRICHHRTHIVQRQRLPLVPEVPDDPLAPFEEEILIGRHSRTLGERLPSLKPTGMRDYMQRVRERHIPPERLALCEELQTRCVKLFYSLIIGGILVVFLYFLIDFLESKYGSNGDSNVTSPLADFRVNSNIPVIVLKPDPSVTDLDANITTPMVDLDGKIINSVAEVIPVLNDVNFTGTNPFTDLE